MNDTQSNKTHAPAPWTREDDLVVSADGRLIARLYWDYSSEAARDESLANAPVVTAAPELLKAARWLLARYAEPACQFGQAAHDETCAACFAHAVIAKATHGGIVVTDAF